MTINLELVHSLVKVIEDYDLPGVHNAKNEETQNFRKAMLDFKEAYAQFKDIPKHIPAAFKDPILLHMALLSETFKQHYQSDDLELIRKYKQYFMDKI